MLSRMLLSWLLITQLPTLPTKGLIKRTLVLDMVSVCVPYLDTGCSQLRAIQVHQKLPLVVLKTIHVVIKADVLLIQGI